MPMVGVATGIPMAEVARPREEFFYLSQLLSRRVVSQDGERVGRLVDLGCAANEAFPRVLTYYVRPGLLAPVTLAVPAPAFAEIPCETLRLAQKRILINLEIQERLLALVAFLRFDRPQV
jgi:hypothetical protein